jgi:ribonucleotide monophosphatase NagD (HAD superfamily)
VIGIPDITIEALIARYGVLLFDAYGVLIDAAGPLAGAVELLRKLNRLGKPYYILTNDA